MKSIQNSSKPHQLLATLLLAVTLFLGTLIYTVSSAYASTQTQSSTMVAMESNAVDDALGSGTTDQIEGKAKKDLGTVQKNLSDDLEDKVKGTAKQVKGRAKQDIGKTKNRLQEAGSDIEDASDNVVDAVKDFFGS